MCMCERERESWERWSGTEDNTRAVKRWSHGQGEGRRERAMWKRKRCFNKAACRISGFMQGHKTQEPETILLFTIKPHTHKHTLHCIHNTNYMTVVRIYSCWCCVFLLESRMSMLISRKATEAKCMNPLLWDITADLALLVLEFWRFLCFFLIQGETNPSYTIACLENGRYSIFCFIYKYITIVYCIILQLRQSQPLTYTDFKTRSQKHNGYDDYTGVSLNRQ